MVYSCPTVACESLHAYSARDVRNEGAWGRWAVYDVLCFFTSGDRREPLYLSVAVNNMSFSRLDPVGSSNGNRPIIVQTYSRRGRGCQGPQGEVNKRPPDTNPTISPKHKFLCRRQQVGRTFQQQLSAPMVKQPALCMQGCQTNVAIVFCATTGDARCCKP